MTVSSGKSLTERPRQILTTRLIWWAESPDWSGTKCQVRTTSTASTAAAPPPTPARSATSHLATANGMSGRLHAIRDAEAALEWRSTATAHQV